MSARTGRALLRGARDLASGALDLLLPPECCACEARVASGALLCPHCDRDLPRLALDRCRLCQQAPGPVCPACAARATPLSACIAAASFDGAIAEWVHRFKYPGRGLSGLDARPGRALAALAVEAAGLAPGPAPGLVVPVPLHPRRLRRRGFNPACVLARAIGRANGAKLAATALRRLRDTPSQTGLDRAERRRNVRGAFAAATKRGLHDCVWLVDDVVTTGATLEEAARALRRAGARRVVAVCAARTLAPG